MITEHLIRKKFVHQTMTDAVSRLYAAWRPAVSAFQIRSGQLQRFAQGAASKHISEGAYELRFFIPLHLRFLDIQYRRHKPRGTKAKGQGNLYNKIVWPILYKHVFPELRYGFTDEVRRELRGELKRAVEI
uniref:Uncharacterized protein n=1 Tax=Prevotella sp. GTC17262 TaxID=3236797 RepID=A0AB33JIU4_9BACT